MARAAHEFGKRRVRAGRLTTSATANRISVSQMPESPCVSSSRIGYQMTPHMLAPMSRLVTGEMVKARLAGH